jgi:peptidoglycan hydrolase-like protein with peptidoglycan-binding domain
MARGSSTALVLISALVIAGAAGTLGYALQPAVPPDLLLASKGETTAPVVKQSFDDARKVQIRLVTADPESLVTHDSGTVTASWCADGGTVVSGTLVMRVDDRSLIGLYTTVPLYRTLYSGDEGADVEALQTELARLGYLSTDFVDGEYGWRTANAVQNLRQAVGAGEGDTAVMRSEFVWLPRPEVQNLDCAITVGQFVSAGTAIASAEGAVLRLEVSSLPENLATGERTLSLGNVTGPISESGVVDDPQFLADIADGGMIAALRQDPEATVTARLALAQPLDAHTLPVGAILQDGDLRCVQAGDLIYRVDLLGSSLGAAVVEFSEAVAPDTVNIGAAITESSCE